MGQPTQKSKSQYQTLLKRISFGDSQKAVEALRDYQAGHDVKERTDPKLVKKQKVVKEAQVAMDTYN